MFDFTINRNGRRTMSRGRPARARRRACAARGSSPWSRGWSFPAARPRTSRRISYPTSPGLAQITDSSLVNPWGVSFSATSPFWVSNQATNTSTLYSATPTGITKVPLTVNIPETASGPQGPTGQVSNNTSSFVLNGMPADFIFANLNGTISAWNGGTVATLEATTPGASYTGLAIASNTAGSFLYAANDCAGDHRRLRRQIRPPQLRPRAFVDPELPSGLVPFDVKAINGDLYVTYAPAGHANQVAAKPGQGAVAAFTTSGRFLSQLSDRRHARGAVGHRAGTGRLRHVLRRPARRQLRLQ